jgi:hypothetical protein
MGRATPRMTDLVLDLQMSAGAQIDPVISSRSLIVLKQS